MKLFVTVLIFVFLMGGCFRKKWKQKTDVVKMTSEQQEVCGYEETA